MKIVASFLALAVTALAQTPNPMFRLFEVVVPADSAAEFYDVQRDTAEIYKNNKAPIARVAWTTLTGTPRFYTLVTLAGLQDLNEPTWLTKQGEETPRRARYTRLQNSTGPSTSRVIQTLNDSSWDPTPEGAPDPFATVATYNVKAGMVADFLAAMKELVEATKKAGKAKSVYVSRVNFGGNSYDFYFMAGYTALADIPSQNIIRTSMGDAAYNAYLKQIASTVNSVERDVLRFRPEYSYLLTK